ncbi:membrane integrity-associated transporter subunit PqiC [Pelomonas sp. KK5]|uniref:PqiC family protein n=1 Tax=Pelomonas sp. KK5 TaxID=1855730 RepID=UPI00097C13DA|nr:PqiC family protein [Pelomonas sp. KK5]
MKKTLLLVLVLGLAACSSGPQAPPPRYYQLRLAAPEATQAAPRSSAVWQLMAPVKLPEYLERDVLWLPVGGSGMQPLPDHRWAEPLDEAVPRLLLHDLAQLRGADRVVGGTLPSRLSVGRQLRVQILELSATPDRSAVHLVARATASDPQGTAPLQVVDVDLSAPSSGSDPDALVGAHRLALWKLAQELVRRLA